MWVFGYGSLMWNPDFAFTATSKARLSGYHRALCIHSTHYRGTLERPGLVFGLDRGGVCDGVAFEVAPEHASGVLANLRRRELIYGVYREVRVAITLAQPDRRPDRRVVEAVTYVAERAHPSFASHTHLARQSEIVRSARGVAGSNLAYVINTLSHMRALGLRDRDIERVGQMAAAFALGCEQNGSKEPARVAALSAAWRQRIAPHQKLKRSDQTRFQHRGWDRD